LHTFGATGGDGEHPSGDLVEGQDRFLYGDTQNGGVYGYGTIFKIAKDGSGYTILYNFGSQTNDGRSPWAGLYKSEEGVFYGTCNSDGSGKGKVFRFIPADARQGKFQGLSMNSDASAHLRFLGVPGYAYGVEYTTALGPTNWTKLATISNAASGKFEIDDITSNQTKRYYRATQSLTH
jgi:uncharacterized repeat protein (TIGR03803 family)